MQLKTFLISSSLILLLANCAGKPPEAKVVVETKFIEKVIAIQPDPKAVQLSQVKWYVVTEKNMDEFLATFGKDNGPIAFMAISVQGYENISVNVQDLRRYILQQRQIIAYYEEAVAPTPAPTPQP